MHYSILRLAVNSQIKVNKVLNYNAQSKLNWIFIQTYKLIVSWIQYLYILLLHWCTEKFDFTKKWSVLIIKNMLIKIQIIFYLHEYFI